MRGAERVPRADRSGHQWSRRAGRHASSGLALASGGGTAAARHPRASCGGGTGLDRGRLLASGCAPPNVSKHGICGYGPAAVGSEQLQEPTLVGGQSDFAAAVEDSKSVEIHASSTECQLPNGAVSTAEWDEAVALPPSGHNVDGPRSNELDLLAKPAHGVVDHSVARSIAQFEGLCRQLVSRNVFAGSRMKVPKQRELGRCEIGDRSVLPPQTPGLHRECAHS